VTSWGSKKFYASRDLDSTGIRVHATASKGRRQVDQEVGKKYTEICKLFKSAREASMRRVAMPSLRCVRATASEVMCPCVSTASSSLHEKCMYVSVYAAGDVAVITSLFGEKPASAEARVFSCASRH